MLSILYGKKLKNEKIYVSVVSLVLFFSFLFFSLFFSNMFVIYHFLETTFKKKI